MPIQAAKACQTPKRKKAPSTKKQVAAQRQAGGVADPACILRAPQGNSTDRTEAVLRATLAAVNAPSYDIGILTGRGMFPRMEDLSASHFIKRVRYLKHRDANGAHIYFRPSGERCYTLLDDLDRAALASMTEHGFEPSAVIETSPGNYQAWLKHIRIFQKELGRLAAQTLARRFNADPSAADWRRFGRLPGVTNRKPKHRSAIGCCAFVQLHEQAGRSFTKVKTFELEIVSLHRSRESERQEQRRSFTPSAAGTSRLCLSLFRVSPKNEVSRPSSSHKLGLRGGSIREWMVTMPGGGCARL